MNKLTLTAVLALAAPLALAKLPAPDDAAKAKAAEAAAKTAHAGKVDAYLLCKSQDKVAAHYRKTAAPAAKPAAGKAAAPASTCADPGPFAYTPPSQKPLEASGAHSPAGTASSPPSTKTPAANKS